MERFSVASDWSVHRASGRLQFDSDAKLCRTGQLAFSWMWYFNAILFVLRSSKTADDSVDSVLLRWHRMVQVCFVNSSEEYTAFVFRIEMFNLLKSTGHVMHTNSLTFNNCTLCPHCIYVFCIYLRTNSDLCHLQHRLIGFYNRDEKCLLRGTNWVFK